MQLPQQNKALYSNEYVTGFAKTRHLRTKQNYEISAKI